MNEHILTGIGLIIILGVSAQWIAWRFKLPSILLLLLFGFLAGSVFKVLDPEKLLGEILFPAVSLSVGVILFEGGLSLKLENLKKIRGVVRNLLTIGALVTLLLVIPASHYILNLNWSLSILLASILVVTGPTVVVPMLRFIRPRGNIASILKWEGMLIDPIGATLAVLAFNAIISRFGYVNFLPSMLGGTLLGMLVGTAFGSLAALIVILLYERNWVPQYLHTPVALIMMLAMFIGSNSLFPESGLMGAIAMGVVMANQKRVGVEHIIEFKEQLGVLLLSVLFIVLSARVEISQFAKVGWPGILFVLALVLVVRPVSVWLSTRHSDLNRKEVLFLSWMAPRGIVAMSVASLFALELENEGIAGAEMITPITIMVVVGTVLIYSTTAGPLARFLNLVEKHPQGVLIVGANRIGRSLAQALKDFGIFVTLVDTNQLNVRWAVNSGLMAIEESIFSDSVMDQISLGEIGYLLALTPDDQINAMACLRFAEIVGKENVFQLNPHKNNISVEFRKRMHGKYLFDCEKTYEKLDLAFSEGANIEIVPVGDDHKFVISNGQTPGLVLFVKNTKNKLTIAACGNVIQYQKSDKVLILNSSQSNK
ncbi:MAG: hypothetical protein CVU46_09740 [Chloroflexi bacterium HGW-Chloroflexi-8]|jgi:NhaP-type Na+/H+ or K+/H+ antiporter|nr:MAG: hypothetical protein CVU46_09740 [Chloroflexi bacterium HGW-Chloroflexi-8]